MESRMEPSYDTGNRILLVVDSSNFEYYCANSAFRRWAETYDDDRRLYIRSLEETDQCNLPNILVSKIFRRELGRTVQSKLEAILRIVGSNHQEDFYMAGGIDVIFAEDDLIHRNFRRLRYPEYKAHRKVLKRYYNIYKVKEYLRNVVFRELGLEEKHGYKFVRVPDCESDDIIAILMKRFTDYRCRVILSSDRDFLQLDNVYQYKLSGERVERVIAGHDDMTMTPDEFRLWKIIRGDISDNIKGVFPRYGDVKSYRLVKDKPTLRNMLSESQEAANRYLLNKYLIDFKSIPADIEDRIYKVLCEKMSELNAKSKENNFSLDECIEI